MNRVLVACIACIITVLMVSYSSAIEFSETLPVNLPEAFSIERTPSSAFVTFSPPVLEWQPQDDGSELPFLLGAGERGIAGGPRLPVYSRLIAVPEGMKARLVNIEIQWRNEGQRNVTHDQGSRGETELNLAAYQVAQTSEYSAVEVGETGRWRDLRIARMTVHPTRYDPVSGDVMFAESMSIEIDFVPVSDDGYNPPGISEAFYPLYKAYVLGAEDELDELEVERGTYLIIYPSAWQDQVDELVEWRTRTGFNVLTATTAETGTSTSSIHDYIDEVYETVYPGLEYVVLLGDVDDFADIETYYINSGWLDPNIATDHKYTYDITGGNSFENVLPRYFIGRMSADTSTEARIIVRKTRQYERNPDDGELSRFERGLVIADLTYAISTRETKRWVREKMMENGYTDVEQLYRSYTHDPGAGAISNAINAGVSWVNYRGFGSHTGWAGPYYTNGNISTLTNFDELPVITSMVCGGGAYDEIGSDPCFGEKWIRVGTQNSFKGAVAFVGPSEIDTHTRWNNAIDGGWYLAMFDHELRTLGQCLIAAKIELYNNYPTQWNAGGGNTNSVWFYFHTYNILGDPALQLRYEVPEAMDVTHETNIPDNATGMTVYAATEGGSPIQNAHVVVSNGIDEIVGSAVSNETGEATVVFTSEPTGGELAITVTRPDLIPYLADLTAVGTEGVSVSGFSLLENDTDDETNGDGIANPGELFYPAMEFMIEEPDGIDNLTVMVVLPNQDGEVVVPEQSYGDVSDGSTLTTNELQVRLSTTADGSPVQFLFHFEGDNFQQDHVVVFEDVEAPLLSIIDHDFSPSWQPGTTSDLSIVLTNSHETLATGVVTGTLSSSSPFITIDEPVSTWNDVEPGEDATPSGEFILTVDEESYPGVEIPVTITLETEEGYVTELEYNLMIEGVDETAPTGPAGPGYFVFEDIDTGYPYTPDFEYTSINGVGENTGLSDFGNNQDATTLVDLPFEFPYWDGLYNQISICSNGWFAFGQNDFIFFRNRPIPSALTPYAGICVFWDDLITSSGGVYTYHDVDNGWFTIEWYNVRSYNGGSNMRFQARLLDPGVHGSPGGLGMIVFLYDTIYNNDSQENRSTIGIISPDGSEGLEYEFNNVNPPTAEGVEHNRQLLLAIGMGAGITPPSFTIEPNVINAQVEPGGIHTTQLTITNHGGLRLSYELISEGIWPDWPSLLPEGGAGNPVAGIPEAGKITVPKSVLEPERGMNLYGGPDAYGHYFIDNGEPGGPVFDWIDISDSEYELEFPTDGNVSHADPIELPFDFTYYGVDYDTIWVFESGFVTFIENNGRESNGMLPGFTAPSAGIFPFWDNIGVDEGGAIHAKAFTDSFVVSWDSVYHQSFNFNEGPYTFQLLLTSDGAMNIRYLDMNPRFNSHTIGIQDHTREDGFTIVYNQTGPSDAEQGFYMHDSLAIRFTPPANWISITDPEGYIDPGETGTIQVTLDSDGLEPGLHEARIIARSISAGQSHVIPVGMFISDGEPGASPVLNNLPGESIEPGGAFHQLVLPNYVFDADNPDAELDWTASLDAHFTVDISEDNVATFSYDEFWSGSSEITFRTYDPSMNYAETTVVFNTEGANDVPRFNMLYPERIDTVGFMNRRNFRVEPLDPEDDEVSINWFLNGEAAGTGTHVFYDFDQIGMNEVEVILSDGTGSVSHTWEFYVSSNQLDEQTELPSRFALESVHPNPFNSRITVGYALPERSDVELRIINVLGREVAQKQLPAVEAGRHQVSFEGRNWSSGIYFITWKAGDVKQVRKAVLVK